MQAMSTWRTFRISRGSSGGAAAMTDGPVSWWSISPAVRLQIVCARTVPCPRPGAHSWSAARDGAPVYSDLNHDGAAEAALVLSCTQSSNSRDEVLVYTSDSTGPQLARGLSPDSSIRSQEFGDVVTAMSINSGVL